VAPILKVRLVINLSSFLLYKEKHGNYQNNKEENLILSCPNCHSLTSTYKGANKNFGREDRRKYAK